jgi:formylglycine-generating enzyme required for sulfatase activity
MAAKVFISYRRDDARWPAREIYRALKQVLPRDHVFMDIDSIPIGVDFVEFLEGWVEQCDIMLTLIGVEWAEGVDPKTGRRRLENPDDFVRIEVRKGLARGIPVVPILLDGATIPDRGLLPDDLQRLIRRNAEFIDHRTVDADVERLIRKLRLMEQPVQPALNKQAVAPRPVTSAENRARAEDRIRITGWRLNRLLSATRQVHWGWIAAIAAGVLVIAYIGVDNLAIQGWRQGSPGAIPDPVASQLAMAEKNRTEEIARAGAETKRRTDEEAKAEADRRQADAEAKRRADEQALRDPALSASGQSFRDRLANGEPCSVCPEMVKVPAGTFTMGSPPSEPGRANDEEQVRVTINRPFAVGKFAVTFEQWDACVADGGCNGYKPNDGGWGRGSRPVINVNWNDAKAFAKWLSRKTGKTYRLLSEAEREYVTRAGTTTPFWWGSKITTNQANYNGNTYDGDAKREYRRWTLPVDSFEANPWGLFNVHGNVWDWTEDCWNDSNQGNLGNGSARTTGDCIEHVVRGGSWNNDPQDLRAADRHGDTTDLRSYSIGFRLARTLSP